MGQLKTAWYMSFAEREGAIVYTEQFARDLVNHNYDPRRFAPGTVVKVEKVVTEWVGSHDDNPPTRRFREVSRENVPVESLREE